MTGKGGTLTGNGWTLTGNGRTLTGKGGIYVHAAVIPPRKSVCPSPPAGTQSLNRSILARNQNGAYTDAETSP